MPTHLGIVGTSNKFTRLNPGDTCDIISLFNGRISTGGFIRWNMGWGAVCKTLPVGPYVYRCCPLRMIFRDVARVLSHACGYVQAKAMFEKGLGAINTTWAVCLCFVVEDMNHVVM